MHLAFLTAFIIRTALSQDLADLRAAVISATQTVTEGSTIGSAILPDGSYRYYRQLQPALKLINIVYVLNIERD